MHQRTQEENPVVNNWVKVNKTFARLGLANLLLVVLSGALIVAVFTLSLHPPTVAVSCGGDTFYLAGKREGGEMTKGVIERHIKRFIENRYQWETLDIESIAKGVGPLTTEGFNKRIIKELKKLRGKLKGTLSQSVAGLKVSVTETSTMAQFDRILRVNKVPFVIPTKISFGLVRGKQHSFNPSGLEINGVKIHELR